MKLRAILVLVFFCFFNYSFSCDCKQIDRENMVEIGLKYEIVFYGEVIKVDSINRIYTFRIIELFKGKYNSQFIRQKYDGNCSNIPSVKELWIVYANFNEDKTIDVSGCSPSSGFKPYGSDSMPSPPEIKISQKTNDKIESLSFYVWDLKFENRNLQDWIYQLEKLRAYKANQNSISQKEKTDSELVKYAKYISIFLFLIIVLLSILIFIVFRKKSNSNNSTFS